MPKRNLHPLPALRWLKRKKIIPRKATEFTMFAPAIGRVAERLGRGLQNLVQQFESARDLQGKPSLLSKA